MISSLFQVLVLVRAESMFSLFLFWYVLDCITRTELLSLPGHPKDLLFRPYFMILYRNCIRSTCVSRMEETGSSGRDHIERHRWGDSGVDSKIRNASITLVDCAWQNWLWCGSPLLHSICYHFKALKAFAAVCPDMHLVLLLQVSLLCEFHFPQRNLLLWKCFQ